MSEKGINGLFLAIILTHIALVFYLLLFGANIEMNIVVNLLVSEGMIMIPSLVYLVIERTRVKHLATKECQAEPFTERMGFKKIKISTALMVVLFTFMVMPLTTLINAISMMFVDNAVLTMSEVLLEMPFIVTFFMVAIFAPFCEEFVFRGIIFKGYRKIGSAFASVLLSGILFGLMHLNFNQAGYALVIGIGMALLVEATGSIFSSMICHFVYNAQSVCIMFLVNHFMPDFYKNYDLLENSKPEEMYITISIYIVISAICTSIAACILWWLAKNEGRTVQLKQVLPSKANKGKSLFSVGLIIAMIIALAYMIWEVIFTSLI